MMTDFIPEWLKERFSGKTRQTQSRLFPEFEPQHQFIVGKSYFALDLYGMNLAEDWRFLTDFAPFNAFLLQFGGDEASRISVLHNPADILQQVAEGSRTIRPDLHGVPLVPERPLLDETVQIFGGMFREKAHDSGELLLDTLGKLTAAGISFPGTAHFDIARIAYEGIQSLFRVDSVGGRATLLRGFRTSEQEDTPDRLVPGWLLAVGKGVLDLDGFTIVDGQPSASDSMRQKDVENTDWLLLRIRCAARRGSYSDLGFDEQFNAFQDHLWNDETVLADQKYMALNSTISRTHHLIEEEKDILLTEYADRRIKEIGRYKLSTRRVGDGAGNSRGGQARAGTKSPRVLLEAAVVTLENGGGSDIDSGTRKTALDRLKALSDTDTSEDLSGERGTFGPLTPDHLDALRKRVGEQSDHIATSTVLSSLTTDSLLN